MSSWSTMWTVLRLVNVRHLRLRSKRALLTMTGIAASVALLVATAAVHTTLRHTIDASAVGVGAGASLAVTSLTDVPLPMSDASEIEAIPGVAVAVPMTRQTTQLQRAGVSQRVSVLGVSVDGANTLLSALAPNAQRVDAEDLAGIALSEHLAATLGAHRNDEINITTPTAIRKVRMSALLSGKWLASVNNGNIALTSLALGQRLFERRRAVDIVYVILRPGASVLDTRRAIVARIGANAVVARPDTEAVPYRRTFDSLATMAQVAQTLGLLVALFLVFNTVTMAVSERRRELSLIGLVGAQPRYVIAAFVGEAAILGLLGGACGTALGFLLAAASVEHAQRLYENVVPITNGGSVVISFRDAATGVACGATVALLGAALAARRIVGIEPIDALRPAPPYVQAGTTEHASSRGALGGALFAATAVVLVSTAGGHMWVVGTVLLLAFASFVQVLPLIVSALGGAMGRGALRGRGVWVLIAVDLLRTPGRMTATVGTLAVCAAMVIASTSAMDSLERQFGRVLSGWYVAPLYVRSPGAGSLSADQPLPGSLGRRLASVPGVRAAYPMRFAMLNRDGNQMAVFALPMAAAARRGDALLQDVAADGRPLLAALRSGEVLVSGLMAHRRDLAVGSTIGLPTSRGLRAFRVAGMLDDLNAVDSVYIEHRVYERVTLDRNADRFAIMPEPGARPAVVRHRLERFLNRNEIPASVVTRQQSIATLMKLLRAFFSLATGIRLAALLVAVVVIASTMLTVTIERRRELLLQRTLGMGRVQLGSLLVAEAIVIAAIAASVALVLGQILGFMMTEAIAQRLVFEVAYRPQTTAAIVVVAATIVVAAAATMPAGWLAARSSLIQMRHE
jgi:putative ABC transport system permease protein